MRQAARYKFKDIYYNIDYRDCKFDNLQVLDLKMGNYCNLTCNICNASASNKIAEKDFQQGTLSRAQYETIKIQSHWPNQRKFWQEISEIAGQLKHLDIYGGEPLMVKMLFNFLRFLIDNKYAKNISLEYNTNGTVYSDKFFEFWDEFKQVKVSFSIDDIEQRFEQQRVGAVWDEVCDNIIKFQKQKSNKFITEVYPTINTQNVFWLPELCQWIDQQVFDHKSFNILTDPWHYNIKSIEDVQKQIILAKLTQHQNFPIIKSVINILDSLH
jgi:organic radical activating enzyme